MKLNTRDIAERVANGETMESIAQVYGCSFTVIYCFCKRQGIETNGVCPHCLGTFSKLSYHAPRCPNHPEIREKIYQYLHEHAISGMIMPVTEYRTKSVGTGLPTNTRLCEAFNGWDGVAVAFELAPFKREKSKRKYRTGSFDKDYTWEKLQKWFDSTPKPHTRRKWDLHCKTDNCLAPMDFILEEWDLTWADIKEEMQPTLPSIVELGYRRDKAEEEATGAGMPARPGWRAWMDRRGQICVQQVYMLI